MKTKCEHEVGRYEVVTFKDNTKHIAKRCGQCGKHLGYSPQEGIEIDSLPKGITERESMIKEVIMDLAKNKITCEWCDKELPVNTEVFRFHQEQCFRNTVIELLAEMKDSIKEIKSAVVQLRDWESGY